MRPNLVAGLDIGSTKTCAVIGEATGDVLPARGPDQVRMPVVKILGVGQARTGGRSRWACRTNRHSPHPGQYCGTS